MSSIFSRLLLPVLVVTSGCSPRSFSNLADYEVLGETESDSTSLSGSSSGGSTTSEIEDSESLGGSTGGEMTDTTATEATDTTADPTAGEIAPILIDDHLLTPNPIQYNGAISAAVWSDSSDGVRMELDDGSVVELLPTAAGVFEGEILALTGLANGEHEAVFRPWRGDSEGEPVLVTYEVNLGDPADEGFWETGDVIGTGRVPAMAVLPDGQVLEFGTLGGIGTSRCYVRRRSKGGAWGIDDLVHLFPDVDCRAVDLEVDKEGAISFLVETFTNSSWRWSLHRMASWGAPLESLGYGSLDETAHALALSPGEGALAVCGSAPTTSPVDESDAMVRVFREDLLGQQQVFDYVLDGEPHTCDERANGCAFLDDETLVVVGQVRGQHEKWIQTKLNRSFDLFYDLDTNSGEMRVAKAGLASQSVASDVDVNAEGTWAMIVGHTCEDVCVPEGQIRTVNAQGETGWSKSLGLYPAEAFAPHAVRSSPAGYWVVASGGLKGNESAFTIQAFAPGQDDPLWVYARKDPDLFHMALTVAIGPFGEVYAGGLGALGYPAVAYIFG